MWPVDDLATRVLMTLLHSRLRRSEDARSALRGAQTELRDLTLAQFRKLGPHPAGQAEIDGPPTHRPFEHPFFWAGFCYTGA
jgi:CHAT domain-containing protein